MREEVLIEAPAATAAPAPAATAAPAALDSVWSWFGDTQWADEKPRPLPALLTRPPDDGEEGLAVPYLPRGRAGMLQAAGGVGKTMALLQLAVSVITGIEWLGRFTVPAEQRGPVCLVLAEEEGHEIARRLWALREGLKLSHDQWHLVAQQLVLLPLAGMTCRMLDAGHAASPFFDDLQRRLETAGVDWSFIALDPLARLGGPETEISNDAATQFVTLVERLRQVRGGPTVIVAHHTSKQARIDGRRDATGARGATALGDGFRWVADLSPGHGGDRDERDERDARTALTLSLVKQNGVAPASPTTLRRDLRTGVLRYEAPREAPRETRSNGARKPRDEHA